MSINDIPSKSPGDLGLPLTNTREPQDNEFNALEWEKVKDRIIEIFSEVGLSNGSTNGSINKKLGEIQELVDAHSGLLEHVISDENFPAHSGRVMKTDTGYTVIKDTIDADVPDENDDETQGYSQGSTWIDRRPGDFYICLYAGEGEAQWVLVNGGGGGGGGDVHGPTESTTGAIAIYSDSSGRFLDDSAVTIDALVPTTRTITTTAPLTGGDSLDDDLTIALPAATDSVDGYMSKEQASRLANTLVNSSFAGTALGRLVRTGTGTYAVVKDGYSSSAPTTGDDSTQGYEQGSLWIDSMQGRLFVCTDASSGAAKWERVGRVEPEATSNTSVSIGDNDHNKIIRCTASSTVTVTVPILRRGTSIEIVQEGDGQVQLAAAEGLTLRYPATFLPRTNEKYSSLVVTMLDGDEALVRGDMVLA